MKAKTQRARSFLCFGAPVTADESATVKNEEEEDEVEKKKLRRSMSKLVRSISFKTSKSSKKLADEQNRSFSGNFSGSSAVQSSTRKLIGKNSDSAIFSSSSLSSSSNSSRSSSLSSSSSLSWAAAAAAAATITREPKLQRKRTFVPPPAPRNNGYAIGLFLVLFSLFVVVFCGRLCAILWTATWLCLVPRRRTGVMAPETSAAAAEIRRRRDWRQEEEEKRRVVTEGFLQRNRKGTSN